MFMYIQRVNMTYEAKDNETIKYVLGHVMMDHPAQVMSKSVTHAITEVLVPGRACGCIAT